MRATVNGLVPVDLGEGLLLGMGYAFAGLSHPAILDALTGVFAMIPFAAKLILCACVRVRVAEDRMIEGSSLFVFGVIVILLADNCVRSRLIGGAVKLPHLDLARHFGRTGKLRFTGLVFRTYAHGGTDLNLARLGYRFEHIRDNRMGRKSCNRHTAGKNY